MHYTIDIQPIKYMDGTHCLRTEYRLFISGRDPEFGEGMAMRPVRCNVYGLRHAKETAQKVAAEWAAKRERNTAEVAPNLLNARRVQTNPYGIF